MRKLSLLAVVLGCIGITLIPAISYAQGPPRPPMGGPMMGGPGGGPMHGPGGPGGPGGGKRGIERMTDELKLTPTQVAKIKPIMDSMRPQMMALRTNNTLTMPQKFAKMKSIRDNMDAKISKYLTPAQIKTWKADRAKMGRFGGPGGRMGGPGGPMGGPGGPMHGPGGPMGGPPHN